MIIEKNGTIIGNWNKEKWEKVAPGVEQLEVNGRGITLSFMRIGPEASGQYAPTPNGHRHYDMEQLTVMLEGHGTVVMDGVRTPVRKGSHWLAPIGIDHGLDLRESPEGVTILQIFPSSKRPPLPIK